MFSVFDNFQDWARAAKKSVTTTCMSSAACIPPSFGAILGSGGGFMNGGYNIDDGDQFHFASNPALTAVAFSGFETRGRPFGLAFNGMGSVGGAPLYLYGNTGFLGIVGSGSWPLGMTIAAPHSNDIVTLMHFAM